MRLLIVGNKGQLGGEIMRQLKQGKSALGAVPNYYDNCEVFGVDIDELDASDLTATLAFVTEKQPDIIFNCAAFTNVDGCENDAQSALKGNATAPRNLAIAADRCGAKLVHISTDYVFDGVADTPYTEMSVPDPQSAYGRSKLLGERYVAQFCRKYFIVRTAWLYGRGGKNFVRTMVNLSKTKEEISVVADQFGCPTNAEDVAHHLLLIAAGEEYGLYHCVGKGSTSWHEFASEIMRLYGAKTKVNPCTTEQYPTPTKRPAYSVLDNLMLRTTVGDNMRDWRQALQHFLQEEKDKL